MSSHDQAPQLRPMAAVGKAMSFVFGNLPHLYATSIIPIGIVIAFTVGVQFFVMETTIELSNEIFLSTMNFDFAGMMSAMGTYYTQPSTLMMIAASWIIGYLFISMFAVRWHRSALFGSDSEDTGFGIEFSPSLFRYIGYAIGIFLITTAVGFGPAALVTFVMGEFTAVASLLALVGVLASVYVSLKLNLALPAAALSIPDFGFKESWRATSGHTGTMFLAFLVMFFAVIGITVGVSIVLAILTVFAPLPPVPTDFDPAAMEQYMRASVIQQLWLMAPSNAILMPLMYGLFTSLLSYIYLQIGKPPAWVEEQSVGQ